LVEPTLALGLKFNQVADAVFAKRTATMKKEI
jgi:hypothetical protein